MKKSIIFLILTLFVMVIIFIFSNQEGNISYGQSYIFEKIFQKISSKFNLDIPLIHGSLAYTVRKYAHVFLYFILGLFTSLVSHSVLSKRNMKFKNFLGFLISCVICFLYACTDEYHQTFIDGRTGKFSDVLVDAIGFVSSIGLVTVIKSLKDTFSKKS
ncbi:MAG: VanZ family protein [Oscillospiraceae bacterium]